MYVALKSKTSFINYGICMGYATAGFFIGLKVLLRLKLIQIAKLNYRSCLYKKYKKIKDLVFFDRNKRSC